ncbi:MAG TPA: DUF2306 domain-containing protein [Puia sp.]|nr:DUF2306 domain-containing protein [Puia sp.]
MKNKKSNLTGVYTILALLTLIGIAIVVRRTLNLIPVLANGYHPPKPASNPQLQALTNLDDIFAHYPLLTLIHIIPGLVFILCGPFQFIKNIPLKYPRWYFASRRIFLISGFVVGITAFIMSVAMPSIGGFNQAAATILFSILFLFFLFKTSQNIQQENKILSREWMIRAYAIGLAIATIRPIIGIFFATSKLSGLTPFEFFGTAFWIGFTIHLIIAEAWIYKTRQ